MNEHSPSGRHKNFPKLINMHEVGLMNIGEELSKEKLLEILNTAKRISASSPSYNSNGFIPLDNANLHSSSNSSGRHKRKNSFDDNYAKRPNFAPNHCSPAPHNASENYNQCFPSYSTPTRINQDSEHFQGISFELLNNQIWELYFDRRQTNETYEKKMKLRDMLHQELLKNFCNCNLYVVGSSMTWLGNNDSDMDMCLMLTDSQIDQRTEAIRILRKIRSLFSNLQFLHDIQLIPATVPILKFVDGVSGIEVDLNINNDVGIRNTQLLLSYARIDERFPPLVVLVKFWAKNYEINDAKNMSLSSYSIVLMVIHYLQFRCEPPVLPCLQKMQKDKFNPMSDVRSLKLKEDLPQFVSKNDQNLGQLFIGFLKYYADEYNYSNSVISIKHGTVLPKAGTISNASPKNKQGHWKFLCIEEPFEGTNTARSIFNWDVFEYIKRVFRKSLEVLLDNPDLSAVL